MSTPQVRQGRLPKPPACDTCKARRVLCHSRLDGGACPRCIKKNIPCTTTPVPRGRPRKNRDHGSIAEIISSTPDVESHQLVQSASSSMTLVSPQALPEGPQLTPELVAHLLDCFDTMPPVMNPLIISTSIKTAIRTVSFQLSLLPPQQRVLAMCMIALAARTSFHEAILGPGPRPQSFTDVLFFASQTDVRACGVRRADACHALHAAALAAAWENGIMLQVSNENAASCYLLDIIETSGMSRPWAVAYFSHLRALAPTWITSVTPRYEPHWAAVFMGEALLSTKSRKPVLVTHEDQLLFCGAEPPSAEELLMSLEGSINKPGAGILFRAMMPYAYHITRLCRQLWRTITGDHARLRPLSESAVLQFLSSLSLIHAILSNLLARAETLLTPEPPQQMSFVFETLSVDSILRGCVYALTIGFTGLVLPLHFELEMRANTDPDNVPSTHARERMDLLRTQVRDMVGVAVRELARMIRHLPTLINVPFPGVLDYAEFALNQLEAQPVVDPERVRDLATIAGHLSVMGYSMNISSQNTVLLLERLNRYVENATRPAELFDPDSLLTDFILPFDQTWLSSQPSS